MRLPKYRTVGGKKLMAHNFAFVPDPNDPSSWRLPIDSRANAETSLERILQASIPPFYFHEVRSRITAALRRLSQEPS